jgi:hypothetical protein
MGKSMESRNECGAFSCRLPEQLRAKAPQRTDRLRAFVGKVSKMNMDVFSHKS